MAVNVVPNVPAASGLAPITLTETITPAAIIAAGGALQVQGAGVRSLWITSRVFSPLLMALYLQGSQVPMPYVIEPRKSMFLLLPPVASMTFYQMSAGYSPKQLPFGLQREGSDNFNGQSAGGYVLVTGVDQPAEYREGYFEAPNMNRYGSTGVLDLLPNSGLQAVLANTIIPPTVTGVDVINSGPTVLSWAWAVSDPAGLNIAGYVDSGQAWMSLPAGMAVSADFDPLTSSYPAEWFQVWVMNADPTNHGKVNVVVRGY